MLRFGDWPEDERRAGWGRTQDVRELRQAASLCGAWEALSAEVCSATLLCDPGGVTASLWVLPLQSGGLEARLLSPILNTLSLEQCCKETWAFPLPYLLLVPSLPLRA